MLALERNKREREREAKNRREVRFAAADANNDVELDPTTTTSSSSALAPGGFELAALWPAAAAAEVAAAAAAEQQPPQQQPSAVCSGPSAVVRSVFSRASERSGAPGSAEGGLYFVP